MVSNGSSTAWTPSYMSVSPYARVVVLSLPKTHQHHSFAHAKNDLRRPTFYAHPLSAAQG